MSLGPLEGEKEGGQREVGWGEAKRSKCEHEPGEEWGTGVRQVATAHWIVAGLLEPPPTEGSFMISETGRMEKKEGRRASG